MFHQLVLPLKVSRKVSIISEFAEETATEYRKHTYQFEDIDIILLEGIYLLKRSYRSYYDLSLWVECTFETALHRALKRRQESLSPDETILAYNTIYFPAQRIHFERDDPCSAADVLIINDPTIDDYS